MTLYEYRCRDCGRVVPSERREDVLQGDWGVRLQHYRPKSQELCAGLLRRVWGFQQAPVMHEHFNVSVQRPISSHRQFAAELRRASDEASERTGIEHRFVPVDGSDRRALGVTDAGLEATNRHRVAEGLKPVPLQGG